MKTFITVIVLLGLLVPFTVHAEDPAPGSSQDNACYAGGSMEGKCGDSEWAWTCGWYIARFDDGTFNRDQVIDTCQILLPPLPPPEVIAAAAQPMCITYNPVLGIYCILGNHATADVGSDGTIEVEELILPAGSICPVPYTDYTVLVPTYYSDIYVFVHSLGFADTDVVCGNFLP